MLCVEKFWGFLFVREKMYRFFWGSNLCVSIDTEYILDSTKIVQSTDIFNLL